METAVVEQFLHFFQDFIDLCQAENWPKNETSENEIKNAFLISQHVEKCLDKLQKQGVLTEFLSVLNNSDDKKKDIKKNCLLDPPKYVLKKIINSNTRISQMDVGVKLFTELFSENRLKECLADLMHEAASKETLLQHLKKELSKEHVLKFRSVLLLTEFNKCNVDILELLKNCSEDLIEILVFSLLNNDPNYASTIKCISDAFLHVVSIRNIDYKNFWKLLFKMDSKYFVEMCLQYSNIFTNIVNALLDCGRLIKEDISAESFYVDLTKPELVDVLKKICFNDCLKLEFFDIVKNNDCDVEFWQNML